MSSAGNRFVKPVLFFAVCLSAAMFLIASLSVPKADLKITEVCPHNETVRYDPVGYYSDYIVLTNESDASLNLENFSLSDDPENLRKYAFPSVTIPAKDSITVWAAKADVISAPYIDEDSLYTGFKLNDHESLFLCDASVQVIDSVRIPNLKADQAYVRDPGSGKWSAIRASEPTADDLPVSDEITPVSFSVPAGFYEGPFLLELSADGNEIFFSLDGSDPKTAGISYTSPLPVNDQSGEANYLSALGPISVRDVYMPEEPVDKSTVIRAVARRADGTFSVETSATYFVGSDMLEKYLGTPTLSVIADPEDLFSHRDGIYVNGQVWENVKDKAETLDFFNSFLAPTNYNMRGEGWRRHADLTLFSPDGVDLCNEDARIGIRGNYTRYVNQKSFSLFPEDTQKLFDGLFFDGNTLVIRTGGTEDMYETNFRDAINNEIARNLAVGSQRSVCCQVFLNGEFWGCYNLQERLDPSFVAARYGIDEENVNLIKNFEAVSGKKEDLDKYLELEAFLATEDLSSDLNYQRFCNMMDIDSLIDYYCCEVFFANDDAYDNNVALWRSRKIGLGPYEDGKWRFLLFDTDCSDGYRENAAANVDSFVDGQCRDINPDTDRFFAPLMKNAAFRERFRNRFLELLAGDFSYERIEPILNGMENTYKRPMTLSIRRFKDPNYSEEQYLMSVQVVRDFFRERGGYICEYLMQHLGN